MVRDTNVTVEELLSELGYADDTLSESVALTPNGKHSLTANVKKEAWRAAGIDRDDPRQIEQHWLPGSNIVILDLSPEVDDGGRSE